MAKKFPNIKIFNRSVKKYIEVSTPLVHRTIERTSSITPYKNEVIQLLNKRVSESAP